MSMYVDPYTQSADHLEMLSAAHWQVLEPVVAEAFAGLPRPDAAVVELGAGTGLGTEVIARALPRARILAVEPSGPLRGILLHRVSSDEGLRARVTVEHRPFPGAALPAEFDALAMINSLGHLAPLARAALWRVLAERLTAFGFAVINLQPPAAPAHVPEFEMEARRVGAREYHGAAWAEPVGDRTMKWHMRYLTSLDGVEDSAQDVEYLWHTLDASGLAAELAVHGLRAEPVGDETFGVFRIWPVASVVGHRLGVVSGV